MLKRTNVAQHDALVETAMQPCGWSTLASSLIRVYRGLQEAALLGFVPGRHRGSYLRSPRLVYRSRQPQSRTFWADLTAHRYGCFKCQPAERLPFVGLRVGILLAQFWPPKWSNS